MSIKTNHVLLLSLFITQAIFVLFIIINKWNIVLNSFIEYKIFYFKNDSSICPNIIIGNNHTHKTFTIDNQTYPKYFHLAKNKSINFECLNSNTIKIKKILLWNSFFGSDDYGFGIGKREPFIKHNCPVINCEITNDRKQLNKSDYVVTHMRNSLSDLPKSRSKNQQWIFYLWESPMHSADFNQYNNYYNLTLTYKIDSNFNGVYEIGSFMNWELNEAFNSSYDFYGNKSGFATAVISNCGGSSDRLNYIKKLQQFIKVDVYGKCGLIKECPNKYKNGQSGECRSILCHEYKFYFAFENSICTDYITEKFFNIIRYNIIPVVLGGGNYEYYIPRSGFINVFDFSSAQSLATYLLYLDSNKTAYNEYFKWKKYVKFNSSDQSMHHFCNLCIQMHLNAQFGIQKSIINNIGAYWSKENCRAPPNFI
jgi:alpha-1,3-fucosyltransferase